MERWFWLVFLLFGGWAAATSFTQDDPIVGAVVTAASLGLAWFSAPWRGDGTRHADILPVIESKEGVVVYWRPGCQSCARLKLRLGDLKSEAHWVNIWQDPEAAAFVRDLNNGDETVPTVVIDGTPVTNPDPRLVFDRLGGRRDY